MKRPAFILPTILVAACAFLAYLNVRISLELTILEAETRGMDSAFLRHRIVELQRALASLRSPLPQATAEKPAPAAPAAVADAAAPAVVGWSSFSERWRDPEVRRLRVIVIQGDLDEQLAGIYRLFNLSPDDLARYRELQLQRRMALLDVFALAHAQSLTPVTDNEGYQKLKNEAIGPIDAEVNEILGPDRIAAGMDYFQSTSQRVVTNQLQQTLSYSGTPLTDQQAGQLMLILKQNPVAGTGSTPVVAISDEGGEINGELSPSQAFVVTANGVVETGTAVSDAAINAATGLLSQEQLAALRALQRVQQSQRSLGAMQADLEADNRRKP